MSLRALGTFFSPQLGMTGLTLSLVFLICIATRVVSAGSRSNVPTLNITTYTSSLLQHEFGNYYQSKFTLGQAAYMLYTKLPTDKSKTNLTWVANQIDPQQSKNCTHSAFSDSCLSLFVQSMILKTRMKVTENDKHRVTLYSLPFGWSEFVTFLSYHGEQAINQFVQKGCFADVSLADNGKELVTRDGDCPLVSKSKSLVSVTGTSSVNCFTISWKKRFTIADCITTTGLPQMAMVVGSGAIGGAFSFISRKMLNKFQKSFEDSEAVLRNRLNGLFRTETGFRNQLSDAQSEISRLVTQVERARGAGYDAAKNDLQELHDLLKQELVMKREYFREVRDTYLKDVRAAGVEITNVEHSNKVLFRKIQDLLDRLDFARPETEQQVDYNYRQSIADDIEGCTNELFFLSSRNALHNFERPADLTQYPMKFSCDLNGDTTSEMLAQENVASLENGGKISDGDGLVKAEFKKFPDKLGGDSFKGKVESVGKFSMGSELLRGFFSFAMDLANQALLLMGVQDMINGAVEEVIQFAAKGFKEVLHALHQVSENSYKEYKSSLDLFNEWISTGEANVLCNKYWQKFRERIYQVKSDYEILLSAHQQCKIKRNYTGMEYTNCAFSYVDRVLQEDPRSKYYELANMSPKLSFKDSLVGAYLYECTKSLVLSGRDPEKIANITTAMIKLTRGSIYKAGMLLQWTASTQTKYLLVHGKGSFINNTQAVKDALHIMQNQTSYFLSTFRDYVAPPAISGYLPEFIWKTNPARPPPGATYFQVELFRKNLTSRGYLAPLVWLPVYAPPLSKVGEGNYLREDKSSPSSPFVPPLFQIRHIVNSTNVTDSSLYICAMIPCYYHMCKCTVRTDNIYGDALMKLMAMSNDQRINTGEHLTYRGNKTSRSRLSSSLSRPLGCTLTRKSNTSDEQDAYSCSVLVEYTRKSKRPARGWAGPYANKTNVKDDHGGLVPAGLPLCGKNSLDKGVKCIPGLFIRTYENNGIKFFANATYALNMAPENNTELKMLKAS